MQYMTILSNNIKSLRKFYGYSQEAVGKHCGVSGSAVSQWEAENSPTLPELEYLFCLSGLFKVTIEQLCHEPDCGPEQTLSPLLDNGVLEKVFRVLANNESINYALETANIKRKAYIFSLLYALCEDDEIDMSDPDALGMVAITGGRHGKTKETITNRVPKKRRPNG